MAVAVAVGVGVGSCANGRKCRRSTGVVTRYNQVLQGLSEAPDGRDSVARMSYCTPAGCSDKAEQRRAMLVPPFSISANRNCLWSLRCGLVV